MKNKVLLISLALILSTGLVFGGCGEPAEPTTPTTPPTPAAPTTPTTPSTPAAPTTPTAPAEPIKIRLTCGLPVTHHFTDLMEQFKQEVESGTDGAVNVELYPGGELFGHRDLPRVLPAGSIEMAFGSAAHVAELSVITSAWESPFTILNRDLWASASDVCLESLNTGLNEKNVIALGFLDYGANAFCGREKMFRVPADMQGQKIRAPAPAWLKAIELWGGTPVSLAAAEVYDALGKGAIDGAMAGWSTYGSRAYYEVANCYVGPTWMGEWLSLMNLNTYNSLPPNVQQVVAKAAKNCEEQSVVISIAEDEKWIKTIKDAGCQVDSLTPEQIEQWKASLKPTYQAVVAECAKAGLEAEAKVIFDSLDVEY